MVNKTHTMRRTLKDTRKYFCSRKRTTRIYTNDICANTNTHTHPGVGINTHILFLFLTPTLTHTRTHTHSWIVAHVWCVYMLPSLRGLARGIESDQKADQQKVGPSRRVNK